MKIVFRDVTLQRDDVEKNWSAVPQPNDRVILPEWEGDVGTVVEMMTWRDPGTPPGEPTVTIDLTPVPPSSVG